MSIADYNGHQETLTPEKRGQMKKAYILLCLLTLAGCGKIGVGGTMKQLVGDWAQVTLPDGCKAKQIAGEEGNGVIVLCEDGRIFH